MAEKLQAERAYSLEKTSADKVTMHFEIHRVAGERPRAWAGIAMCMIVLGFFPGAALSAILFGSEEANFYAVFIGWAATIIFPVIQYFRSIKNQKLRGSEFTRLIFSRDEIETTYKQLLDRSDIEGAWWHGADTSFTYSGNTSYKLNKANSDLKAYFGNYVGVTYGAKDVKLTYETLTESQAQKMADAVARWISNPDAFLAEVEGAKVEAQAA